jgi:hypothetical protein
MSEPTTSDGLAGRQVARTAVCAGDDCPLSAGKENWSRNAVWHILPRMLEYGFDCCHQVAYTSKWGSQDQKAEQFSRRCGGNVVTGKNAEA